MRGVSRHRRGGGGVRQQGRYADRFFARAAPGLLASERAGRSCRTPAPPTQAATVSTRQRGSRLVRRAGPSAVRKLATAGGVTATVEARLPMDRAALRRDIDGDGATDSPRPHAASSPRQRQRPAPSACLPAPSATAARLGAKIECGPAPASAPRDISATPRGRRMIFVRSAIDEARFIRAGTSGSAGGSPLDRTKRRPAGTIN